MCLFIPWTGGRTRGCFNDRSVEVLWANYAIKAMKTGGTRMHFRLKSIAILSLFVASLLLVGTRAAGGHYDPAHAKKHLGPLSAAGHRGDLPMLVVDSRGDATQAVTAAHLTVEQIRGRSIMIHAGGDNYSDTPAPLGGGGARIACGVIH